jgi:hypothetical protein
MTLWDGIFANSTSGGNCSGPGKMTSKGYNLSSDNTCQLPQQRRSQQHQPHAWRRRPVLVTGTSRTTVWAFLVKLA